MPEPEVTMSSQTGRNDPCGCGSGKKYKNCCGAPTSKLVAPKAAAGPPILIYQGTFQDTEYGTYYFLSSNAIDENENVGYTCREQLH